MKKILTLLLTFFVLFSYGQNEHFIDNVFATSKRYKDRFIPDGDMSYNRYWEPYTE